MRAAFTILSAVTLSGCVVQTAEMSRPYVAARLESPKSPADFAACAARAMSLTAKSDEGIWTIIRSNDLGVQVARWDFFAATSGSQAELRSGAKDDAGLELVRACI